VVCNLLTNAAKFMDPCGTILVTAAAEEDVGVIRVRDYGIGLDEDLLPNVFDLFSQGDRQPGREHGGLGIGLTLVKALVSMHDGEVSAFSDGAGKGSEFLVRLPLAQALPPVPQEKQALRSLQARRRILIVDDNVDAAESLASLLAAGGCEVQYVHDGRAAINAVQSAVPDIVLLDIGLPGMDGFEVARRLRRIPGVPALRIIAVTGYGSDVDRGRATEAGFDHHLVKPVDLEDLFNLIG
jgi:CheY-like chemotaxis protein